MPIGVERRKCRRFEVPGATVQYKKTGFFAGSSGFSDPCHVLNLSKGGVAFISENTLRKNAKLVLKLLIPKKKPLHLYGKVCWQSRVAFASGKMTGITFLPFGDCTDWNPVEILEDFRKLEKEHLV
jgi:hypothetical protein